MRVHKRKTILALLAALSLVVITTGSAAACTTSCSGTATLTGGSLSATATAVTFGSTALTGADQTIETTTAAWTFVDPRGSGAAWHATIAASVFDNGDQADKDLPSTALAVAWAAPAVTAGNNAPTATDIAEITTATTYMSSNASTSMGTFTAVPTFTLTVPAESYTGAYTSTLTLTMVTGS